MKVEDKNKLAAKIKQEFLKHCNRYDEWCTKCQYSNNDTSCEIDFTINYLNKRNKLKG